MTTRSLAALNDELRDRIGVETLARSLVPDLTRAGPTLRADSLNGDSAEGPRKAFSIFVTGPRAGHWRDFGAGLGGDLIDLIAATQGVPPRIAARRARQMLDGPAGRLRPAPATAPDDHAPVRSPSQARAAAQRLWRRAEPLIGSLGERYLREGRGLAGPPWPEDLRYHPSVYHGPTGKALPGLLGAVRSAAGDVAGLIRIYLAANGRGKAAVPLPKTMLGACAGGAVRLAPAGSYLAVCEGIETGLAIQEACGYRLPVWAAGTIDNLAGLQVPESVETLILCNDANPPGSLAAAAAERAARALRRAGRRVLTAAPTTGSDFLDQLTAAGADSVRTTIRGAIR